ncbi:MAG: hypothetical protein IKG40_02580 [Bacilli bacterium]|nr:hypothetical protein [Bacilli bacterium]
MEKKSTGKTVVIVILLLALLGLGGYIVYDKIVLKELQKFDSTEKKSEKQPNLLSNEEAIRIGQDLYLKTRDLYCGGVSKLMNNENYDFTWRDNSVDNYVVENGVATKTDIEKTDGCGLYKYPDEVAIAIKNLFTESGLDKFLDNELKYNKRWVVKDNSDNFYMLGCLSHSGVILLDEITIKPTSIEENTISFIVSDYMFEAGLDESEYNINSSKATKLDNTFKIAKENDSWKVEDYTDSHDKYLQKNNN